MNSDYATRKYRSPLREAQAIQTREQILGAALNLLSSGEREVTMRAVARLAGISERTIFRHFASQDILGQALYPLVAEQLRLAPLPQDLPGLLAYADPLFRAFDAEPQLSAALLFSEVGRGLLAGARRQRLDNIRAILDRAYPERPPQSRAAAALAIRHQLSGAAWHMYRQEVGLPLEEAVASTRWAIQALLAPLGSPAPRIVIDRSSAD